MHEIQVKLLKLINERNIGDLTLRDIGSLLGEKLPQKVKHHLSQLQKKGFISIDKHNSVIKTINTKTDSPGLFISIPILGAANCGPQTIYAEQNIEGYLKLSKKFLNVRKNIFALRADGDSMNKASIRDKSIDDGDFVIINNESMSPKNGDYILSIIDGMANIKRYIWDKENNRILLISESTKNYPPIIIHPNDDFLINGKVVDVIKKPKMSYL